MSLSYLRDAGLDKEVKARDRGSKINSKNNRGKTENRII